MQQGGIYWKPWKLLDRMMSHRYMKIIWKVALALHQRIRIRRVVLLANNILILLTAWHWSMLTLTLIRICLLLDVIFPLRLNKSGFIIM